MSKTFRNMFLFVALTAVFLVLANTNAQVTKADGKPSNQNQTVDKHAFLGVRIAPVPQILKAHLPELPGELGVVIEEVTAGSPASNAGLKQHDIVTQFDGQAINSPEDFVSRVEQKKPDDRVSVKFIHGGKEAEATVILSTAPVNETPPDATVTEVSELKSLWKQPFSSWLESPSGKKQTLEFDRRERDRQNNFETWSTFQAMSVTKSADGTYSVKVEYRENDKDLKREFTGTREEIRDGINKDEELPEGTKQHLLRSLDQQTPDMFRFDWPKSFREMFDRDWDQLRNAVDSQVSLRY